MKSYLFGLFLGLLHLSAWGYGGQAEISGKANLDPAWARKVYVCKIASFNLMFTASDELIVAEGNIDQSGNFKVSFPAGKDNALFRLHFIRRNDPASTLIIGGNDENHAFFIAKEADHIYFQSANRPRMIQQAGITGGTANQELNSLFRTISDDAIDRSTRTDVLLNIAGRSASELVALLAIHNAHSLNNMQKDRVQDVLERFGKDSPYGADIFREYQTPASWPFYLLAGVVLAVTGGISGNYLYKKLVISKIQKILSHREINIVNLILSGKSNKEIAIVLNIELSTVKTHVNNIYTKLNIRKREELNKYKNLLPETGNLNG